MALSTGPMTIYDIPQLVPPAHPLALTPSNIPSRFRCTGIYPLNCDIFIDADFAPSYVVDREQSANQLPENLAKQLSEQPNKQLPEMSQDNSDEPHPSPALCAQINLNPCPVMCDQMNFNPGQAICASHLL
ncbi:hypothetical protein JTB14_028203 [Gonioctena quinquepunctata]|nr:hypothetical protein JTB14_028203 [Gonioctena quinquepunctata]